MKIFPKTALLLAFLAVLGVAAQAAAQAFTVLHTFSSTNYFGENSDGANPEAGLVLLGDTLYGTAFGGGDSGNGTVFSIETNGNFTSMHSFEASVSFTYNFYGFQETGYTNADGIGPASTLLLSGNTLYGSTTEGGPFFTAATANNGVYPTEAGTLFSMTLGGEFNTLYYFPERLTPYGALTSSGNILFGTTALAGVYGSVFSVDTQGTDLTTLYNFSYGSVTNDGFSPGSGLILSGNYLFGTTSGITSSSAGFGNNAGTIFAINLINSHYNTLYAFSYPGVSVYTNSDGMGPYGRLILSGGRFYGTTCRGGLYDGGTIYAVNTDGSGFTNLHYFSLEAVDAVSGFATNSDGFDSLTALVLSGNTLYGTTFYGGTAGNGTVFAINTDGKGFTTLHTFNAGGINNLGIYTNSDGVYPQGDLTLAGNTLYGTTENGGTNGNGTIFSIPLGAVSSPAVQLSIYHSGNKLVFTWPTNATGYTLQSTTNLASPVWTTVAGQFTVTNPISSVRVFYRLSQ